MSCEGYGERSQALLDMVREMANPRGYGLKEVQSLFLTLAITADKTFSSCCGAFAHNISWNGIADV